MKSETKYPDNDQLSEIFIPYHFGPGAVKFPKHKLQLNCGIEFTFSNKNLIRTAKNSFFSINVGKETFTNSNSIARLL